MSENGFASLLVERKLLYASSLRRYVTIDFYLPKDVANPSELNLLLINDGQDLGKMKFAELLDQMISSNQIPPLVCVGIHAGRNRKMDYGVAGIPDFQNRGAKAGDYKKFITERLIPFIHTSYCIEQFKKIGFAGFSLGGLSALDIAWMHPEIFSSVGVFSGSLWWRKKDLGEGYVEETDRIMHNKIKEDEYKTGLQFYFTTGSLDETADRNNNGIIDSIDDTTDLVNLLKEKGYSDHDIVYINYEDGRHDVETWGRAMPQFLLWAFSSQ